VSRQVRFGLSLVAFVNQNEHGQPTGTAGAGTSPAIRVNVMDPARLRCKG